MAGTWFRQNGVVSSRTPAGNANRWAAYATTKHLLLHRNLLDRFLSLCTLAAALFRVAWALSYFLLPVGVLRGRTGAQLLAGSEAADSFLAEWLRIATINLTVFVAVKF